MILLIPFLSFFFFPCPSCILTVFEKMLIVGSQILYLCTCNFCTDSFLFHIIFLYAFWKQTELVNNWYTLICRQILNPEENFAEWKLCTCSLTVSLTFCICGSNRFSTLLWILHSQIVRNTESIKWSFILNSKNGISAAFLIWGSNSWWDNNKYRKTFMQLWKQESSVHEL